MTSPLAQFGRDWQALSDRTATYQADLLRRIHRRMADALDRAAQRDIEGAQDWRNLQTTGSRYAD